MDFKNLKIKIREPEVSRLLPNLCDLHKKIHRLGCGFKNLSKIYRLAYGFLFFVIPISGFSAGDGDQTLAFLNVFEAMEKVSLGCTVHRAPQSKSEF
jgi:hypothetical protein